MKKALFFVVYLLIASCSGSSANKDFNSLISKVPFTNLPIGVADLGEQSSIKIDWEHPNKMDEIVSCDFADKYSLNKAFFFENLELINYVDLLEHSLLSVSSDMIFAKRLPQINEK